MCLNVSPWRHKCLLCLNVSQCVSLETHVSPLSKFVWMCLLGDTYVSSVLLCTTFSKLLSVFNIPASTKQTPFPLYSVPLMMEKMMMNLINFALHLKQKKQKIYKIIALFTQLPEVWNECVFIATNRFCLTRLINTPTRHHYDVTFFSDVIRHSRHFCDFM